MRKYFKFIISALFLLSIVLSVVNAQNIDSLLNVTNHATEEQKINANIVLSDYFFYSIPDTAEYYLKQALEIAQKEKLQQKQGVINLNLGILYNERGLTTIAEKYFLKVIDISKEINDSSLWVNSLGNMGNSAMYVGNYSKALEHFTQIVDLFEQMGNNSGLGNAYGAIGNIYVNTEEYDKALEYYNTAKDYFLLENDSLKAAILTLNSATIHTNKEQYELAIDKYNEAIKIFRRHKQKLNEAECLGGLASIYKLKNHSSKAFTTYLKALKIYKELDAKKNMTNCYKELGDLQSIEKNTPEALKYYNKAYTIAYELKNYAQLKKITFDLQEIYSKQQQYAEAYKYSVLNKTFSDSLISMESVKKFNELEIKFETKQKEQQIELLTKENEITEAKNKQKNLFIAILIVSFIAAILFFVFLINRRQLKAKQKQILNEQKLNRLQMSPHFIYNTLISVQNFMLENDTENSVFYMSKFAKLMRDILESTQKDFINLDDELDILGLYVEFQQLRSINNFEYIVNIDPNIDVEATLIPPMIIQPFIENSIKHAFNDKIENPTIHLMIEKRNKKILIKVSDNGVGIKSKKNLSSEKHNSLAISITQNRLKNMFVRKSVIFNIQDISEIDNTQTGTIINIEIPEKLEF